MNKKVMILIVLLTSILTLTSCNSNKYINLDFNNGSSIEKYKISNLEQLNKINLPSRDGYKSTSWYLDSSFTEIITSSHNFKLIDTLYLKWVKLNDYGKEMFLEVYNKAELNYINNLNKTVISNGEAITSLGPTNVKQVIYSKKDFSNNYLKVFNASSGFVNTFVELEYLNDTYTLRKGKPDKEFNKDLITYEGVVSLEDYISEYGVSPYHLNYIINNETLIDIINFEENNDNYIYKIKLSDNAASNYKNYIIGNNSFESRNVYFSNIIVTFHISKDFNFNKVVYLENYEVEVKILGRFNKQNIENNIIDIIKYEEK